MTRSLLAVSAIALGLSTAASTAPAQPYGKGGNYSPAPAARPQSQDDHARRARVAGCDCRMMRGDNGMRDHCMDTGARPEDMPPWPGSPG